VILLTVAIAPERIERGEHIAYSMCAACPTVDGEFPLNGGTNLLEDIPMPLGAATPPNLTPSDRIADWSDDELMRAIREGTNPSGHRLAVMSSQNFGLMAREDLESIIAYLRTQPEVEFTTKPKQSLTPLSMVFVTIGFFPLKPLVGAGFPTVAPVGPTVEYGEYLAGYIDCVLCHGEGLPGGTNPIGPPGPSLGHVAGWATEQFVTTLRTGVNPNGEALDPDEMPWEYFGRLNDEGLTAVYGYAKSVV
jgi:mono/diheme cytochrome c family protein